MFDLEQAIAEWRRQLAAGGIKSPEVLDELESHLREDIASHLHAGLNETESFDAATERIGQAGLLKTEFAKIGGIKETQERLKHFVLTLAGIPSLATTMNTPHAHLEPRWATYLKGAMFLAPALVLWTLSVIFVFPKLQQICRDAGVMIPSVYQVTNFMSNHNILICAAVIGVLALLEWRWRNWPRYRRASIGVGVFLLNAAVMVFIFMMVVLALLAAPTLMSAR